MHEGIKKPHCQNSTLAAALLMYDYDVSTAAA